MENVVIDLYPNLINIVLQFLSYIAIVALLAGAQYVVCRNSTSKILRLIVPVFVSLLTLVMAVIALPLFTVLVLNDTQAIVQKIVFVILFSVQLLLPISLVIFLTFMVKTKHKNNDVEVTKIKDL